MVVFGRGRNDVTTIHEQHTPERILEPESGAEVLSAPTEHQADYPAWVRGPTQASASPDQEISPDPTLPPAQKGRPWVISTPHSTGGRSFLERLFLLLSQRSQGIL